MDTNKWQEIKASISKNELFEYVSEYLDYIKKEKEKNKDKLASRAGFEVWVFEKRKKIINTSEFKNKDNDYKIIIKLIENKQLSQVEQNSIFGMFGQAIGHSLMLKRGGYEDKITNVNVEMPKFTFNDNNNDDVREDEDNI